jgi:septal ring factor EnvC (AmiA/AmiB activator)
MMNRARASRGRVPRGRSRLVAAGALLLALGFTLAPCITHAQPAGDIRGTLPAETPPDPAVEKRADREARQAELEAVERAINANAEAKARLEAELKDLRADQAKLRATLIVAAEKTRLAEERYAASEARLEKLAAEEAGLKRSLAARRDTIVEVLAVLQRMGRKPPPAVLVRADDMLEAVRAAIVLGAVLPHLRSEAETVAAELAELVKLKQTIAAERKGLASDIENLAGERARLSGLVAARQARLGESERDAAEEAKRTRELASRARNLRDLLHNLESELGVAAEAVERARKAAETLAVRTRERLAAAALKNPARLEAKAAFHDAKGRLPSPVSGQIVRAFGAGDDSGEKARGMTIAGQPGATVQAPADGKVEYAGPFRTFGQVLILNAGGGYYIVLSGMQRIDVEVGQFVLAGEPVARLGAVAEAGGDGASAEAGPNLYVELRKDGQSIDPAPWWPQALKEKVRG